MATTIRPVVALALLLITACHAATPAPFELCTSASDAATVHWAASNLASWLSVGCPNLTFVVQNVTELTSNHGSCLAVGPGAAKVSGFKYPTGGKPEQEGFAAGVTSVGYALTGDPSQTLSSRGTMYAALDFAERVGLRFISNDMPVTVLPGSVCPWNSSSALDTLFAGFPARYQFTPPLEYRSDSGWHLGQSPALQVLQRNNGAGSLQGGGTTYATPPGFVHTSYKLMDNQSALYKSHNEWFWPRDDPAAYGQLCWSNASLVQYMTARVIGFLRAQPQATVISVSQNDNGDYCNSTEERAVYAEEGALMGPLLRAVNTIADAVATEFPGRNVAIDTLAYQWSRQAPAKTVPRPNVIIRLCSIECNFGAPLSHSSNIAFQTDIQNWALISNRTWIWNYVTDFANYVMPWPDYHNLAPNTRFYLNHGVRGIYQEAAYQSPGADLAELKNYLMGKLMFDPMVDPERHMSEFCSIYYGEQSAPAIAAYVELWSDAVSSTDSYLRENVPWTSPYLMPHTLLQSAAYLEAAVASAAVAGSALQAKHCRVATLPTLYVILLRWNEIVSYAAKSGISWPYAQKTLKAAFARFNSTYSEGGVTHLSEGGNEINWLAKQLNMTSV